MKYGTWNVATPQASAVQALCAAGYSPLTARVLSARGYQSPEQAQALLCADAPLTDPFAMKEMDAAVRAVRSALERKQRIAVFGDYDVDGITATCLLADYLRSVGADCLTHIPGRLEEGYGLNRMAIVELYEQGVRLIITVDCGITAIEEAELCRQLGIALVITDHHECKERLPRAAAVVDPHRPDRTYPHTDLSGVGIAFKLAAALHGNQDEIAARYCDFFCLGTIADVMPLRGENRRLVVQGLRAMRNPKRVGLRALIEACDCGVQGVTASTIGYVLAPRINAAGRMEHAELAVDLFLTENARSAEELAQTLCRLNKERQAIELEIYREAASRLRKNKNRDSAIVLAGEDWHQGVVGIVASRLSEEFCRPTFLICLSGEHGKASSRSYGGFNLFASLQELSPLLDGYGGHELAAGFTIPRRNIDEFRRRICERAESFAATAQSGSSLDIDCEVPAALLTEQNVLALSELEPCGTGCPRPVFCMSEVIVEQLSTVGNGKHLRLKLRSRDGTSLQAIYFSSGALSRSLHPGDRVDIAFHPNINEYRGVRCVQLSLLDLHCIHPQELYDRFLAQEQLPERERSLLAPSRVDVIDVWHYLSCVAREEAGLRCSMIDLCCAVADASSQRHSIRKTAVCLDILKELGLISLHREYMTMEVRILPQARFNALQNSTLYRSLGGGE